MPRCHPFLSARKHHLLGALKPIPHSGRSVVKRGKHAECCVLAGHGSWVLSGHLSASVGCIKKSIELPHARCHTPRTLLTQSVLQVHHSTDWVRSVAILLIFAESLYSLVEYSIMYRHSHRAVLELIRHILIGRAPAAPRPSAPLSFSRQRAEAESAPRRWRAQRMW